MKTTSTSIIICGFISVFTQLADAQKQQSPPSFNHIYLSVRNVDSSLRFYTQAFDLKETYRISQLEVTQTDSAFKRAVNIVFLKFPGQDLVFELGERTDKMDTTIKTGNL